jgi:hypothetical protein
MNRMAQQNLTRLACPAWRCQPSIFSLTSKFKTSEFAKGCILDLTLYSNLAIQSQTTG